LLIRSISILIGAAFLEVSGVAMMRLGLQRNSWLLPAGIAGLAAYGIVVNHGGVDFGRLMGVYIVVFFVVSQTIGALFFHQTVHPRTIVGGALIVAGGAAILR
jgi:drug/metabolite transporter (DMT)-like permease